MKTQVVLGTASITAVADIARLTFVGLDGDVCAAAAKPIGVAEADTGQGKQCPVNLGGILLVTAGGVIAAKGEIEVGANGKAVAKAAGVSAGYAIDAAAADGDIIRIRH